MLLYYAKEGSEFHFNREILNQEYLQKNLNSVIQTWYQKHTLLFPWQQSLSVKNQISPMATFLSETGGLDWNTQGCHTLLIRSMGVDDSFLTPSPPRGLPLTSKIVWC